MGLIALVPDRIDIDLVRRSVDDPGCGAVLLFEGIGRNHFKGRAVTALEYEAYVDMAEPEMERIAAEAAERWAANVAIVHRTGRVAIGEPSVVIAVSTPHRVESYEASRYAIDALKQRVPIWKKEIYADGSAWKANSPAVGS